MVLRIKTAAARLYPNCFRTTDTMQQTTAVPKASADTVALGIFGGYRPDLGADRRAGQHDEDRHDFNPPLQGIGEGTVEARNHHLEQIGSHRDMGRTADQVDQGRHAQQTAPDPQKPRQQAGDAAHPDRQPDRAGKTRHLEVDHRQGS